MRRPSVTPRTKPTVTEGQGLARLETQAMLHALVERVDRIELTAPPTWALNNIIRRHESLPLKLIAA